MKPSKETPPTSSPPSSACSLTSSLRPQLLESLRPGPRAKPSERNKQPGKGVGTEVRAPLQRGPPPARPAGDGQVSPPRRLPARSLPRPRTRQGLGRSLVSCPLALRAQFTDGETEAATRTGNPCPSTQPGAAAVASHRELHYSEKPSLGQGRVEKERRRETPAVDMRPRLEDPGWGARVG